jgi:hypothetical protein
VKGIARTPGGLYVVPLTTPGRVQLYDSNWHFVRGWQVDTYGKDFKVACNSGGVIDVFTRARRSFFNEAGEQLPDEESAPGPVNLPSEDSFRLVPTPPLLLPLSSPLFAWLLLILGGAGRFS